MIRTLLAAALIAPALAAALPASAETTIVANMPAITASLSPSKLAVRVRVADGVMGHTAITSRRTLTVQAYDAAGASLGQSTATVSKRLTYATVALTPAMKSAARYVVSAK